MKTRLTMLTAAFLLSGSMAFGAITTQGVIDAFSADGFTRIDVKRGPTQMKVEAIRGTTRMEVVYDIESGAILKSETTRVRSGENTSPGASVRDRDQDFVRVGRGSRSDDGTDDRNGRGGLDSNDDGEDTDRGHGNDDDHNDDDNPGRGGNDNDHGGRGGSDDSSDDSSSDDSSDEDSGDDDSGDDD